MPIDKFGRTLFDRCYDLPIRDFSRTTLQSTPPKYYLLPIYITTETVPNKSKVLIFSSSSLNVFIIPIKEAIIESVSIYPSNSALAILFNGKNISPEQLKGKSVTQKDTFVFSDPTKSGAIKHLITFVLKCPLID